MTRRKKHSGTGCPVREGAAVEALFRVQPVPLLPLLELSLADLETERLFIRNHRGTYFHNGEGDFQFSDVEEE